MLLELAKPCLRTFRLGVLPAEAKRLIPIEECRFADEQIWVTQTFRNFRSPHRFSNYRKKGSLGAFAVSHDRLIAYAGWSRLINVERCDPRLTEIDFAVKPDLFEMTFSADQFQTDWSGQLMYRIHTRYAEAILDCLGVKARQ